MATPEKRVQTAIINYLKSLKDQGIPIYFERRQATATSKTGIPDLFVVCKGKHIEIECKKPIGGELRTMQEKQRDILISAGAIWICPTSVQEVKDLFEELIIQD